MAVGEGDIAEIRREVGLSLCRAHVGGVEGRGGKRGGVSGCCEVFNRSAALQAAPSNQ
jgi:hypothetical protein